MAKHLTVIFRDCWRTMTRLAFPFFVLVLEVLLESPDDTRRRGNVQRADVVTVPSFVLRPQCGQTFAPE